MENQPGAEMENTEERSPFNSDFPADRGETESHNSTELSQLFSAYYSPAKDMHFPLLLGKSGSSIVEDLYHRPNVLIAGTTGSGKTQLIYNQVAFLLSIKKPKEVKFIFCGSKSIDYEILKPLRTFYLAAPKSGNSIVEISDFGSLLQNLLMELDERIRLFTLAGVKTISDYNNKFQHADLKAVEGHHYLPDILLVIDDLFNYVALQDDSNMLTRLLQQNRYTGIYLLACTSQVYAPNINKNLKSNFVFRIAMKVMSQSDSRKIIDHIGAEKLINPGSLLYNANGSVVEVQSPEITFEMLGNLVLEVIKSRKPDSLYELFEIKQVPVFDAGEVDKYFADAARLIVMHQQGSTSLIQRKLKLGYNRAGHIMDQLEAAGVVGTFFGSKAREVLYPDEYSLEQFLAAFLDVKKNSSSLTDGHPKPRKVPMHTKNDSENKHVDVSHKPVLQYVGTTFRHSKTNPVGYAQEVQIGLNKFVVVSNENNLLNPQKSFWNKIKRFFFR